MSQANSTHVANAAHMAKANGAQANGHPRERQTETSRSHASLVLAPPRQSSRNCRNSRHQSCAPAQPSPAAAQPPPQPRMVQRLHGGSGVASSAPHHPYHFEAEAEHADAVLRQSETETVTAVLASPPPRMLQRLHSRRQRNPHLQMQLPSRPWVLEANRLHELIN